MKKIFAVLLVFASVIGFTFASGKGDTCPDHAVGHIKWYGSAPFAYPGFVTVEGNIYTIAVEDSSSFSVEEISALQGYLLQIDGRIDKLQIGGFQVLKDGVFVVSDYKKLSK